MKCPCVNKVYFMVPGPKNEIHPFDGFSLYSPHAARTSFCGFHAMQAGAPGVSILWPTSPVSVAICTESESSASFYLRENPKQYLG